MFLPDSQTCREKAKIRKALDPLLAEPFEPSPFVHHNHRQLQILATRSSRFDPCQRFYRCLSVYAVPHMYVSTLPHYHDTLRRRRRMLKPPCDHVRLAKNVWKGIGSKPAFPFWSITVLQFQPANDYGRECHVTMERASSIGCWRAFMMETTGNGQR